jgi:hypothetical protein
VAADGERLGGEAGPPVSAGELVVADRLCLHAALFGEIAPGHEPGPATTHVALFSVGVPGVPSIHVEEALWTAAELLRSHKADY